MNKFTFNSACRGLVPLLTVVLGGCMNLAPKYQEPAAAVPTAWPQATVIATNAPDPGDMGWRDIVRDARLSSVIDSGLANNRDLRVAVLTIEQARSLYRIQAANQSPSLTLNATSSKTRGDASSNSSGQAAGSQFYASNGISYELDLFGLVHNQKQAALETYLNTEEAQRSVRLSLVAEITSAWLTLAADQAQLQLARDTLVAQQDSYALTARRKELGAASGLTLAQAQTSVETARGDVASYQSQVDLDRNALTLLVGASIPEDLLPSTMADDAVTALIAVPAGVPSTVLQRRPDVLAAEHRLKASYADIGAARAALFPQISLTAAAGTVSSSLTNLFKGDVWSIAAGVSQSIFDGGARRANVQATQVGRDIQLATYDKTLQTAFREVADALAVRNRLDERLSAQQALVAANARSLELATARFRSGADSYLEVLDAQRSLYSAQQSLISLQLAEQSNRVALFKALGGGWRDTASPDEPTG